METDLVQVGTYVAAGFTLLSTIVTAVDAFVKATPTKKDDEALGPTLKVLKSVFARFSLLRGSK